MSENDYLSFYYAGRNIIFDLPNLYNSSLSPFPFRYFPISAYFFTPFSLMGLEIGYFVFQLFNFFLNILIIFLMYKIIQTHIKLSNASNLKYKFNTFKDIFNQEENEAILHQYGIFLIALPSFMNYFLGQINIIVSIFILSSLFLFLKGTRMNDFIGGLLIGLGIMIRPTLILLIPFLLVINYNRKTKKIVFKIKQTAVRLSGSIILIILSGIYFLIYPQMFADFISVNLTGEYTYAIEGGIEINPSFSLTRIVLIIFEVLSLEISGFLIFSIITLIILIPIYFLYIQDTDHPLNLINGYFVGLIVLLIVYFDSWPHHILVLTPFIIFFLLMNKKFRFHRIVKYLHYLIAILMVSFWGIFYLTYQFFPFNIGGLILMILLYYCLIIYYRNQIRSKI
ncbi:MAG: glycosyltransferase 87 family protein [Candidatus Thorarchaeota archaeon]